MDSLEVLGRDRPVEIEVTPAMLKAGVGAVAEVAFGDGLEALLIKAYVAMRYEDISIDG